MKNHLIKGSFLMVLSSVACIASDILSKSMTMEKNQQLFFRFFLAFVFLATYQIYKKTFYIENFCNTKNLIRGTLFGIAMSFFLFGLKKLSLGLVILLNFCTPIFTILLSKFVLNENLKNRLSTCLMNTLGIFIAIFSNIHQIDKKALYSILMASVCFSVIDVYNKYYLNENEKILDNLTGSSLFATIFFIGMMQYGKTNTCKFEISNFFFAFLVSITAILIPFFTLQASKLTELSALQPIKYIEFPLSIMSSYLFFNDKYTYHVFIGFLIIIIGTSLNTFKEIYKN